MLTGFSSSTAMRWVGVLGDPGPACSWRRTWQVGTDGSSQSGQFGNLGREEAVKGKDVV